MSNKYSDDGRFIIDATGKQWSVDSAHPLPFPLGFDSDDRMDNAPFSAAFLFCGDEGQWRGIDGKPKACDTHWLARAPLPPVPKVKTQEELDERAYEVFCREAFDPSCNSALRSAWDAALAYARNPAK